MPEAEYNQFLSELTEDLIEELATPQSFERGISYYEGGAVLSITRRGNHLLAEVQGSEYEPYKVNIVQAADRTVEISCTCLYDWGGICKHCVAVLLTLLEAQNVSSCAHPSQTS